MKTFAIKLLEAFNVVHDFHRKSASHLMVVQADTDVVVSSLPTEVPQVNSRKCQNCPHEKFALKCHTNSRRSQHLPKPVVAGYGSEGECCKVVDELEVGHIQAARGTRVIVTVSKQPWR